MIARAQLESDPETREILVDDGKAAAVAWRCPRMGHAPNKTALDDDHREALRAIEALTGQAFSGCALAGAWAPWVHRAVEAEEHGLAEDRAAFGPPPRALIDAVRVLRRAKRQRDAEEARVAREKVE